MKQKPYGLIKDSHMIAPTFDWMSKAYAKHTETTQIDIDWYFEQKIKKMEKEKNKNAIS